MNKITNILLAVVAAATIGTGVAVLTTANQDWGHQQAEHACYVKYDTTGVDYDNPDYDKITAKQDICINEVYGLKASD